MDLAFLQYLLLSQLSLKKNQNNNNNKECCQFLQYFDPKAFNVALSDVL